MAPSGRMTSCRPPASGAIPGAIWATALGDEHGMMALLASLPAKRKILIHINNTNPILNEQSPQRQALTQQGIEVSWDGMAITLQDTAC